MQEELIFCTTVGPPLEGGVRVLSIFDTLPVLTNEWSGDVYEVLRQLMLEELGLECVSRTFPMIGS